MKTATIIAILAIAAVMVLVRYNFGDPQAVWVVSFFLGRV